MMRHLYKRCLIWLLPLLVVHSLVPVGFMVSGGERGIEIAFCPVQSAPLVQALGAMRAAEQAPEHLSEFSPEHAHHAAHATPHAGDVAPQIDIDHSEHARSSGCPFALAGAPLLAGAGPAIAVSFVHPEFSRLPELAVPHGISAFASNRIRGPPQLA